MLPHTKIIIVYQVFFLHTNDVSFEHCFLYLPYKLTFLIAILTRRDPFQSL